MSKFHQRPGGWVEISHLELKQFHLHLKRLIRHGGVAVLAGEHSSDLGLGLEDHHLLLLEASSSVGLVRTGSHGSVVETQVLELKGGVLELVAVRGEAGRGG